MRILQAEAGACDPGSGAMHSRHVQYLPRGPGHELCGAGREKGGGSYFIQIVGANSVRPHILTIMIQILRGIKWIMNIVEESH